MFWHRLESFRVLLARQNGVATFPVGVKKLQVKSRLVLCQVANAVLPK